MTFALNRNRLSGAAMLLLAPLAAQPANAWGGFGHQAIAWVAEDDLKAKLAANHPADAATKWAVIQNLISSDPWVQSQVSCNPNFLQVSGEYHLADISSWADWVRNQDVNNDHIPDGDNVTDHSVRLPLNGGTPDTPACTGKVSTQPDPYPTISKKCADQAVTDFKVAIANSSYSQAVQQRSLKYVVHLVGDLHQPLHGSSPIGYNYVSLVTPYNTNYGTVPVDTALETQFPHLYDDNPNRWYTIHQVWDTAITHDLMKAKTLTSSRQLASYLTSTPKPASMAVSGTPRNWAEESSNWATTSIYTDTGYTPPPTCWSSGAAPAGGAVCTYTQFALTSDYTARKWNIVAFRLRQAGLRLSCVLYKSLYPAETDPCNP